MTKLEIKVSDRKLAGYIINLVSSACQTVGMTLVVRDENTQLTIEGHEKDVTLMKKIIENQLKRLIEIKDKIKDQLEKIEKAEITRVE